MPHFFERHERLAVAALAALLAFVLYASCLSSTVTYGGDCGELIAASYRLGIAHPTGYPLYCLLGRTWSSLLPLGEIGWRYNVMSALCGALAVGFFTAALHRILCGASNVSTHKFPSPSSPAWAALGAGLLLAGFFDFWSQAVIAEVYPLGGLMLCALFYVAVAWHQSNRDDAPDWRWFYTLALLFGLALNAHLSCVFLVPGLLFYVLIQHRARFRGQWFLRLATALALCVAGWSLTLYLPLRSGLFPAPQNLPPSFEPLLRAKTANTSGQVDTTDWWPLDWTHPVTARDWYAHISARQYKRLLFKPQKFSIAGREIQVTGFASTPQQVAGRLLDILIRIAMSYLWTAPLILVGFFLSWKRSEYSHGEHSHGAWLGSLLFLPALANVGVQINYQVGDVANFFFPFYIALAFWLGLGLAWLWRRAKSPFAQRLVVVMLISAVASQWILLRPAVSKNGDTSARDHALDRAVALENLAAQTGREPYAILIGDDALWSFWYAKFVLGRASQTHTPWRARRTLEENNGLDEFVAHWKKSGPVALSGWDEQTDARFPLVMLNRSGTLCLASDRVLPPPAQPLPATQPLNRVLETPIKARFVHQKTEDGIAVVKRENMAAFEIDFRLPWSQPLNAREAGAPTFDRENRTLHVGYAEVFLAQTDPQTPGYMAAAPTPEQRDLRRPKGKGPTLLSWKQRRRVVIAQGTPVATPLRLAVPLFFHQEAMTGKFQVWVRLVRSTQDASTPWQKSVALDITG